MNFLYQPPCHLSLGRERPPYFAPQKCLKEEHRLSQTQKMLGANTLNPKKLAELTAPRAGGATPPMVAALLGIRSCLGCGHWRCVSGLGWPCSHPLCTHMHAPPYNPSRILVYLTHYPCIPIIITCRFLHVTPRGLNCIFKELISAMLRCRV